MYGFVYREEEKWIVDTVVIEEHESASFVIWREFFFFPLCKCAHAEQLIESRYQALCFATLIFPAVYLCETLWRRMVISNINKSQITLHLSPL